jgi:hypothetical protein
MEWIEVPNLVDYNCGEGCQDVIVAPATQGQIGTFAAYVKPSIKPSDKPVWIRIVSTGRIICASEPCEQVILYLDLQLKP